MKDIHLQAFVIEAKEMIDEIEQTMLELESNQSDTELIDRAFRAMHTLKGSSGMFGFDNIRNFTHNIENVFDKIREGSLSINKDIISCTLEAGDIISKMVNGEEYSDDALVFVSNKFDSFLSGSISNPNPKIIERVQVNEGEDEDSEEINIDNSKKIKYNVKFEPIANIFKAGTNPLLLIRELADLGEIQINANHSVPEFNSFDPEICYTKWDVILNTDKNEDDIRGVFLFVEDDCHLQISKYIELSDSIIVPQSSSDNSNAGKSKVQQLNENISKQNNTNEKSSHAKEVSSIRVNSDKLDELVDLVGELVIVQAKLAQIAIKKGDMDIASISEEVERLTWNLRDSTLNIRMLTIGTTFSKFKRLVRDLSSDLNKQVELTAEGGETELDKTVIDKLNDPLVHIIRNSIDHGIELPDIRVNNGKNPQGTIQLSASQSGGNVFIKISDDGAGLNRDRIYQKALEKGLISEDKEFTEQEIYNFVFLPGFSTAAAVTNLSGRGVGMDVVKRSIESLKGSIEIESKLNQGTVITLKLPLTLAIIEGLLVQVANDFYVIPLNQVNECLEMQKNEIREKNGRHLIESRGSLIPYISLKERFDLEDRHSEIEQVVVVNSNNNRVGINVDQIIGEQQVVIKSLGTMFTEVDSISGATILGDGTVALIIDINNLILATENDERNATENFKNNLLQMRV